MHRLTSSIHLSFSLSTFSSTTWRSAINSSVVHFSSIPLCASRPLFFLPQPKTISKNVSSCLLPERGKRHHSAFHTRLISHCLPSSVSPLHYAHYSSAPPSTETLDSIIKLDLLRSESAAKIEEIWLDYHKQTSRLSAALPASQYENLKSLFTESPRFIIPVEKNGGFITVLTEIQDDVHLITRVSEYQEKGEMATPDFKLKFYTDLVEEKGIVLMRSDAFSPDSFFTVEEGQIIVGTNQIFYLNEEWYEKYVSVLNHDPQKFNFEEVIRVLTPTVEDEDEDERSDGMGKSAGARGEGEGLSFSNKDLESQLRKMQEEIKSSGPTDEEIDEMEWVLSAEDMLAKAKRDEQGGNKGEGGNK